MTIAVKIAEKSAGCVRARANRAIADSSDAAEDATENKLPSFLCLAENSRHDGLSLSSSSSTPTPKARNTTV